MKRTKSGEETGTRHSKAAQTQHWTQDYDYSPGDPDADTRTVRARLQSHAGGAVICFSGRFKLQLTADLFIPASLNTSIISRKKKKREGEKLAIWWDVMSNLDLKFLLLFMVSLLYLIPTIDPVSAVKREELLANMGAGGVHGGEIRW